MTDLTRLAQLINDHMPPEAGVEAHAILERIRAATALDVSHGGTIDGWHPCDDTYDPAAHVNARCAACWNSSQEL